MAEDGIKISQRAELPKADIAAGDWLAVVDTSAGSSGGKKFDASGVVWTAKNSTVADGVFILFGDSGEAGVAFNSGAFLISNQSGGIVIRQNAILSGGDILIDNRGNGFKTRLDCKNSSGVTKTLMDLNPDTESAKTLILRLVERAAPGPDVAGEAQIWLKNTVPNELWFRDDAGTDRKVALV